MVIEKTKLQGCLIITPKVFKDDRGYFFESFNQKIFQEKTGFQPDFVQDNQSFSQYGVVRGLHRQIGKHAQAKLVRVLQGKVLDVVVDARPNSSTFGKVSSVVISAENKKQIYVPKEFLHGFAVLSESAVFAYKCDNYYHKPAERGVRFDDPDLNIDWQIPEADQIISPKDWELPFFAERE